MKTIVVIGGNHSALIHAISLMNCNDIVVVAADREPRDIHDECLKDVDEFMFNKVFGDHQKVIKLDKYDYGKLKGPISHLDNQSFIQQKMQGKRRTY